MHKSLYRHAWAANRSYLSPKAAHLRALSLNTQPCRSSRLLCCQVLYRSCWPFVVPLHDRDRGAGCAGRSVCLSLAQLSFFWSLGASQLGRCWIEIGCHCLAAMTHKVYSLSTNPTIACSTRTSHLLHGSNLHVLCYELLRNIRKTHD